MKLRGSGPHRGSRGHDQKSRALPDVNSRARADLTCSICRAWSCRSAGHRVDDLISGVDGRHICWDLQPHGNGPQSCRDVADFQVTFEQFLIQHDRPGQGLKSKTSLRILPQFNQSRCSAFPGQLPKAAKNVNIQLATMVLAESSSKFLAWPRIDLLVGPLVAVHRRRNRQSACQSRKWGHGNQAAGLKAVHQRGWTFMNITTGGSGIENTVASQLCFPTSLELLSTWSCCSLTKNTNTRRHSLPPSLAFSTPRRI